MLVGSRVDVAVTAALVIFLLILTVREGEAVVAVVIDKQKAKPITSMMAGLRESIPNQFTGYIHVKEATSVDSYWLNEFHYR